MRALCEREHPPGVVTYLDGTPVGWCSISPRSQIPRLERSKLIRPVDDVPVWSIICVVVRGGYRRKGVVGAPARGRGRVRRVEGRAGGRGAPGRPAGPDGHDDGVRRHPLDVREGRVLGGRHARMPSPAGCRASSCAAPSPDPPARQRPSSLGAQMVAATTSSTHSEARGSGIR